MSYLHLQKTWPLIVSVSAHAIILAWGIVAYIPPKPVEAHTKPMVIRLVDLQSKPTKIIATKSTPQAHSSQSKTTVPLAIQSTNTVAQPTATAAPAAAMIAAVPEVTQPVRTAEEFTPPSYSAEYLHNPTPEYPPLARRRGEQGRVVLHVTVSESGAVAAINISQSSGFALLDQSALTAVRGWRFVPATFNNHPTVGEVAVPIRFTLES